MAASAKRIRVKDEKDIHSEQLSSPEVFAPAETMQQQTLVSPCSSPILVRPVFARPYVVRPVPMRAVPPRFRQWSDLSNPSETNSSEDEELAVNRDAVFSRELQQRGNAAVIEMDSFQEKPQIIRPKPRAVAQQAAEEFYEQAHTQGIPGLYLHKASVDAHDWHRKWVLQDDKAHVRASSGDAMQFYALHEEDRMAGARNPSLDDDAGFQSKRPLTPSKIMETDDEIIESDLVRPVALRVHHPTVPQADDKLPSSLMLRCYALGRSISPLTVPSLGSSFFGNSGRDPIQMQEAAPAFITVPDNENEVGSYIPPSVSVSAITKARDGILHELAISGGESTSDRFKECLQFLESSFTLNICESDAELSEGKWLTLTKPNFFANLGENDNGDPMYTLGRMSFDMFAPTQLVCSLQGTFNSVEKAVIHEGAPVPKALQEEVASGAELQTYDIISAFSIESPQAAHPNAPNKDVRRPIRGIMTTTGYTVRDPATPNRQSVWITGGKIEPNDDAIDQSEWRRLFTLHPPTHGFAEKAKLLAVKILMGAELPKSMNDDGSMSYSFTRPLGGHGMAYVDNVFLDDSLRIVRGHRGNVYCFSRLHDN